MLDLEVIPERSLGCEHWEFILGMQFSQAVCICMSQVAIMKRVQVIYNENDPLASDLILSLTLDGIRLLFDSVSQRLKVIEIFAMNLIKLKYCGLVFNSSDVIPTIDQIDHSFGATHPGIYDPEKRIFTLNFRGLSFTFPVEQASEPRCVRGLGSLQFTNGASPVASKMFIFSGNSLIDSKPPPLPISCFFSHPYLQGLEVIRHNGCTSGIKLSLICEGPSQVLEPRRHACVQELCFGASAEDVLTLLGAPSRVFYKDEDKMRIHSPQAHRRAPASFSDYFYNYFTLGLDALFDGKYHKLKKFVLHTNYPGHYNFNMYHRCEFKLQLPTKPISTDNSKLIDLSPTFITVSAYSRWDEVCEKVQPSSRPIVLHRSSSTNTTNPFGSTFCYGVEDIIFEVMPNNLIASVTLYASDDNLPLQGQES
ncbi:PHAF1 protein CG7083-like [Daphnia carinata]|uniref:PHAF1 protein CG7083-like n=1 Tax=Daphnia carinata TaxID=120202 RepID=UPI00257BDE89|nr:PHAF1 protein CG7083-like [Daphnia carinata]